ncbi:MAG: Fe2+-dependent dioxygenase [Bryobacterales bacterium]|nr:Fe2+-dependent dioxygenase [Bryobacterales bacterium]
MLLEIPHVLNADQVREFRAQLEAAEWVDGRITAGRQSATVKDNAQIPEDHPVARDIGAAIVSALERHPLFVAAALPMHVFPPLFNRYSGGQSFGTHVDNAIRQVAGTNHRIRTDLSATLFFAEPEEYEGGELVVEDTYGVQQVKFPAGSMVLYPSTSLHHVRPVTSGARLCAFFWIQSMVREDSRRTLLFDLDMAIQQLNQSMAETAPGHVSAVPAGVAVQLTGIYHNLIRQWAEV